MRKYFIFILLISFTAAPAFADGGDEPSKRKSRFKRFQQSPERKYKKARRKHELQKLTIGDRLEIINWATDENKKPAKDKRRKHRHDKMVRDVFNSTPLDEVNHLLDTLDANESNIETRFAFLGDDHLNSIRGYVQWYYYRKEKHAENDSRVFNFPYALFREQLLNHLDNSGDDIFQSHYTDFCGKVALARLWIIYNREDYVTFMTDLYFDGKARWNKHSYEVPVEVIEAVNYGRISKDPGQKIAFRNPEKMPEMMDMVLCLTLANSYHTLPFKYFRYDPDKHKENSAWAGAAINPQITMLEGIGFQVEKVGDNFRGLSESQFHRIKRASNEMEERPRVLLLVNSSMLDSLAGTNHEYDTTRAIEHKMFGTHWITVDFIGEDDEDPSKSTFAYWEYGIHRKVTGDLEKVRAVIAGGIIINGYRPEKD
jgi:hypothetical protein